MKKNNSGNSEGSLFPEHQFLLSCFRIGLHMEDLKQLTYIDVLKIILSIPSNSTQNSDVKKATQDDINRYLK